MKTFKRQPKSEENSRRLIILSLGFYVLAFLLLIVRVATDELARFDALFVLLFGVLLFQLHKIWSKLSEIERELTEVRNEAKKYRNPPKQKEEFTRSGLPE